MTLWSAKDAEAATQGDADGDWNADGVSIDSRTLAPGDLFVALADNRDGHLFVGRAFEAGASAAVVERIIEGLPVGARLLKVKDGLGALNGLGRAARERSSARVIAVTGSAGKTSTKEVLRHALSAQAPTHSAEQSFNNHWGVPLTLARLPRGAKFAIVEIGMNSPGEILPLSKMARPHSCLVTMVGNAHLAAFDSIEAIAEEKASIFGGMDPGGTAIVNCDSPGFEIMRKSASANSADLVAFGESVDADWRILDWEHAEACTVVKASIRQRRFSFELASHGKHFAVNALGALAAIKSVGGDIEYAKSSFKNWSPPVGRGSRFAVQLDGRDSPLDLIDDSYNSNPSSLDAALKVLVSISPAKSRKSKKPGKRIAVLGDMLELGSGSRSLHENFARHEAIKDIARIHCAGPLMRCLYRALPESKRGYWCESSLELAEISARLAEPGDTVLVKGSKGSKISIVAEAIKNLKK